MRPEHDAGSLFVPAGSSVASHGRIDGEEDDAGVTIANPMLLRSSIWTHDGWMDGLEISPEARPVVGSIALLGGVASLLHSAVSYGPDGRTHGLVLLASVPFGLIICTTQLIPFMRNTK
jgi:hypothetical protein